MPINSNRYVDIISSIGGVSAVSSKELLLRVFVDHQYVPRNSFIEYDKSELADISEVFGSDSLIYKIASFYLGFVSKQTTSPKKIQFSRWCKSANNSMIIGFSPVNFGKLKNLGNTVNFDLTVDGTKNSFTFDFSNVASESDVATEVQSKLKAKFSKLSAKVNDFKGLTIDFGETKEQIIEFTSKTSGALIGLGIDPSQVPTISSGGDAESVTQTLDCSTSASNNYGSFIFIDNTPSIIANDVIAECAKWVSGRNVEFMYLAPVTASTAQAVQDSVKGYASTALTLVNDEVDMSYILPAAVLASQDFSTTNAAANYMYQMEPSLQPTIYSDKDADIYDKISVNFYGRTQESGIMLDFYQKGVLQGGINSPKAMGVHASEQWFKSTIKANFLSMFLALNEVDASITGKAISISYLNDAIKIAKNNGTIISGKELDITEINYITQLTGDHKAYLAIQNSGYWFDVKMLPEQNEMHYLLLYSKSDSVNKIEGRHSII